MTTWQYFKQLYKFMRFNNPPHIALFKAAKRAFKPTPF